MLSPKDPCQFPLRVRVQASKGRHQCQDVRTSGVEEGKWPDACAVES